MSFKKVLGFLAVFILIERFCYLQTHGFTPVKIIASHPYDPFFEMDDSPPSHLKAKFSQKLYFLGSGKQFYAFETEDRSFVIKFLKQSRRRPLPYLEKISLPKPLERWKSSYLQARQKRLSHLLLSCKIAYNELQEETALCYTHLNTTPHWQQEVTLVDNLGIEHLVDLGKTAFIVQRKGDKIAFTQTVIDNLITLTIRQCQKGIANLDPLIERNYGLLGQKAINLDCGSFAYKKKLADTVYLKEEVFMELLSLRDHLKKKEPELLLYFDNKITEHLNSL